MAYEGLAQERRQSRQDWFEQLLADRVPPQVEAIPQQLRQLLKEYLVDFRAKGERKGSTLDVKGRNLIAFFKWLGENDLDCKLNGIQPEHISAYLLAFKSDGMTPGGKVVLGHSKSPMTMAKRVGVLRSFFIWAMRRQLCVVNPVHGGQFVPRNRLTAPLPEADVAHLITVWTTPHIHPRVALIGMILLVYGLFPRQLLALDCTAFDLGTNQFHGLRVPVPIPPVLRPVLERYLSWRSDRVDSPLQEQKLIVSRKKGVYSSAKHTTIVNALRPYGVSPRQLRVTALAETVKYGNLKLLSVFGLTTDGAQRYRDLARLAEQTRKVIPKPNLW